MTRNCIFTPALLLLAALTAWGGREFPANPGENVAPDELLLKLTDGSTVNDIRGALPALAKVIALRSGGRHLHLTLPPGLAKQLAAKLAADPHVVYVEPNRIREA